jgi:hypothetical protein
VLVIQTIRQVTSFNQVVIDTQGVPGGWHLVEIDHVPLRDTPQVAILIVVVGRRDLPAVFIHIEYPARILVAAAFFQLALNDPDPVQLVAGMIRVDVTFLQDVRRLFSTPPRPSVMSVALEALSLIAS